LFVCLAKNSSLRVKKKQKKKTKKQWLKGFKFRNFAYTEDLLNIYFSYSFNMFDALLLRTGCDSGLYVVLS